MSALHEMMGRYAQAGRVDWIGLRSVRRGDLSAVAEVMLGEDGLAGDHGRPGKRAVTLVQAEHLAAIGAFLGTGPVLPAQLRRNLVVSRVNLAAFKGRGVAVGSAVIQITTICAPCSRMEEVFGPGGYSAVRGHGGWCAQVVTPGRVRIGDALRPVD